MALLLQLLLGVHKVALQLVQAGIVHIAHLHLGQRRHFPELLGVTNFTLLKQVDALVLCLPFRRYQLYF